MKTLSRALFVAGLATIGGFAHAGIDITLNKYIPVILDSTEFPVSYVYEKGKANIMQGRPCGGTDVKISITPFFTQANKGTSLFNNAKNSELGDLAGRWNLLTILNTQVPKGYTANTLLGSGTADGTAIINSEILSTLVTDLGNIPYGTTLCSEECPPVPTNVPREFTTLQGLQSLQNSTETFGYLTIPSKFRSYGARLEIGGSLECGLGALVKFGFGSVSQTGNFNNAIYFGNVDVTYSTSSTTSGTTTTTTATTTVFDAAYYFVGDIKTIVNNPFNSIVTASTSSGTTTYANAYAPTNPQWYTALKTVAIDTTNRLNQIAKVVGLNLNDFQRTGFEDLRGEIFWRKAIKLDRQDITLLIPFVSMFGTLDLADAANPLQPLAVSLGNDGFRSLGGGMGFTVELPDGLELGAAFGAVGYNSRVEQRLPMPNAAGQSGIYPYQAETRIHPGKTWYVSVLGNAYHFEDDASFYGQYIYVNHGRDHYTLINPDPIFMPEILEGRSIWSNHMLNFGLNVDISSGISLGCAAQIPLKQKNSARSSSFLLSLIASY